MTDRRELADRLEGCISASGGIDLRDPEVLREAARHIRELRVVGVAHLYRLEGHDDPRAVPVMIAAPAPARHGNLFALVDGKHPDESGFILSDGTFADRKRAWQVALHAEQIIGAPPVPGTLFSEDLW